LTCFDADPEPITGEPHELAVLKPLFTAEAGSQAAAVKGEFKLLDVPRKANLGRQGSRFWEELFSLSGQLVRSANVVLGREPQDRRKVISEFVGHDLSRCDDHAPDFGPPRRLDNDVLTRFEAHASRVEIEQLPGVPESDANDG